MDFDKPLISPSIKRWPSFSPPLNIGVLASGNGSNFEALVRSTYKGSLNATVSHLIVNNPNCEAINRALKLGVQCDLLDHRDFNKREDLDNEIVKLFKAKNIEIIVMAGWMRIVTDKLVESFPGRLINIHPSILPSFKGIDAIKNALNAGVKITGCSVHLVSKEVDSGEILVQAAVAIDKHDSIESLSRKIQVEEHKLLPIGVAIAAKRWRGG